MRNSQQRLAKLALAASAAFAPGCSFLVDGSGAESYGTESVAVVETPGGDEAGPESDRCDLYVAPGGSDAASGEWDAPFESVQALADHLGEQTGRYVGCLRKGTYVGHVTVTRGGDGDRPVVFTSAPGTRAKVVGRFTLAPGADYVTVSRLDLQGKAGGDDSPAVFARHSTWEFNDVWHPTGTCFTVGGVAENEARADDTTIRHNRIHDCGNPDLKNQNPSYLNHKSGIRLSYTTRSRVEGNLIIRSRDVGLLLYPHATNSTIRGNIIDRNGVGVSIGGDYPGRLGPGYLGYASEGNDLEQNVVTFSRERFDVETYFQVSAGGELPNPDADNVISGGCIYGSTAGGALLNGPFVQPTSRGVMIDADVESEDPEYSDPATNDYQVGADACRTNVETIMSVMAANWIERETIGR